MRTGTNADLADSGRRELTRLKQHLDVEWHALYNNKYSSIAYLRVGMACAEIEAEVRRIVALLTEPEVIDLGREAFGMRVEEPRRLEWTTEDGRQLRSEQLWDTYATIEPLHLDGSYVITLHEFRDGGAVAVVTWPVRPLNGLCDVMQNAMRELYSRLWERYEDTEAR